MVSQGTTDLHILALHHNPGQLYLVRNKHCPRSGLAFIADSNVDVESIQLKTFFVISANGGGPPASADSNTRQIEQFRNLDCGPNADA
ncbi:hypothetical protein ACIPUD_14765 [Bradyrhizobium sp. CAR08]